MFYFVFLIQASLITEQPLFLTFCSSGWKVRRFALIITNQSDKVTLISRAFLILQIGKWLKWECMLLWFNTLFTSHIYSFSSSDTNVIREPKYNRFWCYQYLLNSLYLFPAGSEDFLVYFCHLFPSFLLVC